MVAILILPVDVAAEGDMGWRWNWDSGSHLRFLLS